MSHPLSFIDSNMLSSGIPRSVATCLNAALNSVTAIFFIVSQQTGLRKRWVNPPKKLISNYVITLSQQGETGQGYTPHTPAPLIRQFYEYTNLNREVRLAGEVAIEFAPLIANFLLNSLVW